MARSTRFISEQPGIEILCTTISARPMESSANLKTTLANREEAAGESSSVFGTWRHRLSQRPAGLLADTGGAAQISTAMRVMGRLGRVTACCYDFQQLNVTANATASKILIR